jgi:hypothetical protein
MRYLLFIIIIGCSTTLFAQCKTYKIGVRGDTLNCTDANKLKQGKWVVHVDELRGEPGYEEEGVFKDDKKEGTWRVYTLMGDLAAIEHYRWGFKDGINDYYNMQGIVRQESWKAVNPANPYDTIEVPDLHDETKIYQRVIKIEGTSVKYGIWKYYDPATGSLIKTEEYVLDKLVTNKNKTSNGVPSTDSTASVKTDSTKLAKPQAVLDYEKKNKSKKIKVRDGATGY